MSSISPNMNLIVPTVGTTPGPDWATDLNSSLTLVDQHDHTPGKGVPITPAGISINADLSFQSNNATNLRTSRYTSQAAPLALASDRGAVYVSGADLYYNDTAGNQIRITQGGSVAGSAGTITGLPSGTASASYSTGTFTWQAATVTPATMDQGPTVIREAIANGNGATLTVVNGLSANYPLVLPTLPASQKIMTLDNSGNITAPYSVDGSTIDINSNTIRVAPLGITSAQLAAGAVITSKLASDSVATANIINGAVTTTKILDGNVTPQKLSTAVQGSNTTTTVNQTPSATVTLTLIGRPVLILVSNVGNGQITSNGPCALAYTRSGSDIASFMEFGGATAQSFSGGSIIDTSGATGSVTFGLRASAGSPQTITGGIFRLIVVQL